MLKKYITTNYKQTQKLGRKLAKEISKKSLGKMAVILGLRGDLGGGKTTFLQGFAMGLGIKEKILSPTFVIMKHFPICRCEEPKRRSNLKKTFTDFYHFDCYRINKPAEILELRFKEIISNPKNIVAIEWSERIKKILPKDTIFIQFKFMDKNKREIIIQY